MGKSIFKHSVCLATAVLLLSFVIATPLAARTVNVTNSTELSDALSTALKFDTIVLNDDIVLTSNMSVGVLCSINLNGHGLTVVDASFTANDTLYLFDSQTTGQLSTTIGKFVAKKVVFVSQALMPRIATNTPAYLPFSADAYFNTSSYRIYSSLLDAVAAVANHDTIFLNKEVKMNTPIVLSTADTIVVANGKIFRNANFSSLFSIPQSSMLVFSNVVVDGNAPTCNSTTNGGLVYNSGKLMLAQGSTFSNSSLSGASVGACVASSGVVVLADSSKILNSGSTVALLVGGTITCLSQFVGSVSFTCFDVSSNAIAPVLGKSMTSVVSATSGLENISSDLYPNFGLRKIGSDIVWTYSSLFTMDTIDLGLPSGTLWASCNLGSTSTTGSGSYFSWGELTSYDNFYTLNINSSLTAANDVATVYLGNGWRMPSRQELQELISATNYSWVEVTGVKGLKFTSRKDPSKFVFLPAAGWMESGILNRYGEMSAYWSRNIASKPYELYASFSGDSIAVNNYDAFNGQSVRAVVNRSHFKVTVANVEGGSVSGATSGMYAFGTEFNVKAVADSGYHFVCWNNSEAIQHHVAPWGDTVLRPSFQKNSHFVCFLNHKGDTIKKDSMLFGDPIVPPSSPFREGHLFIGWGQEVPAYLPDADYTFVATYSQKYYTVTWSDTAALVYNGTNRTVKATYVNDFGQTKTLTVKFYKGSLPAVFRNAGVYKAVAIVDNNEYAFTPISESIVVNIAKAPLSVSGVVVEDVKMHDGSANAVVVNSGTVATIFAGDDVSVVPSAAFENADAGYGKRVTVSFSLQGPAAPNYATPAAMLYSRTGRILSNFVSSATNIQGNAKGYCEDEAVIINYQLLKGNPSFYRLLFSNEAKAHGFEDIDWTPTVNDLQGYFTFTIPSTCRFGNYSATLQFKNELDTLSAPITVSFVVNISTSFLKRVFDDVIALDLNKLQLQDYCWYRNGSEVDGARNYYYQQKGGLTGTYYLCGLYNGEVVRSCPVENLTIEQDPYAQQVSCYPNPATSNVYVRIDGEGTTQHTLRMVNAYGVEVSSLYFSGNNTSVSVQSLPAGSYMIVVDGVSQRVVVRR